MGSEPHGRLRLLLACLLYVVGPASVVGYLSDLPFANQSLIPGAAGGDVKFVRQTFLKRDT